MRQYQAIWNHIKLHKKATVLAPDFNRSKIIQAVMKERSADLPFRRLLEKHNIQLELIKEIDPVKDAIYFSLVRIEIISADDL